MKEQEKHKEERQPVCKIKSKKCIIFTFKEILFILAILVLVIGIEYVFDTPAALQVTMMKYYDLSYYQYSLFYSLYSVPNIFHSIFGGYLIDRLFGIKIGTVLYLSVAFIGIIIFAAGAQFKTFWLMLFGRLVSGIGAEMSGTVCKNYFIYSWFKDSYLNLVYSLADNMGYLGTLLSFSTSQNIYELFTQNYNGKKAVDLTLIITSAAFIIPFIAGLTMAFLKPLVKQPEDNSSENRLEVQPDDKIKFTDCLKFPREFWLLCFLYGCYTNGVYTIEDFQQDLIVKEFSKTVDEANHIINVLIVFQVCISVPFSLIVDRMGRNTLVATASILVALLGHMLMCLRVNPYITLGLLGVSYSLMGSTIWPMFAYPLQKKHHGLGYGIASCFGSFSLAVCPMLAGRIIDAKGYFAAEYFYFATLTASFLSIVVVKIWDSRSSGVLSMTAEERKEYLKRSER